jgi:hypothetical protein
MQLPTWDFCRLNRGHLTPDSVLPVGRCSNKEGCPMSSRRGQDHLLLSADSMTVDLGLLAIYLLAAG